MLRRLRLVNAWGYSQVKPSVVKVGGSLFELPAFGERLLSWIEALDRPVVLLAGGGPYVDFLRLLSKNRQISDTQAHWLAIEALSLQANLLAEILASGLPGSNPIELHLGNAHRRLSLGESFVFNPCPALKCDAGRTLPVGWHVTSDSIGGWLAKSLGIGELILLKSTGPLCATAFADAVANGWIDEHLPEIASELLVQLVNLRSANPTMFVLTH